MPTFENVYVFVTDALRADHLPSQIQNEGVYIDTIASSTISPTSFASIVSGLHPPEHGVKTFFHELSQETSILALDDYNTNFWQVILEGGLYDVLGQDPAKSVKPSEVEPPFIYIERENSTHAPYDEWKEEYYSASDDPRTIWGDRDTEDMWARFEGDWETVRERYRSGAETAAGRFLDRMDMLRDKGILDETLLIFTSDHGELLGEYSARSHSEPVVEELVRVPTVIVSTANDIKSEINRDLMSHVDIAATIEDILNTEFSWDVSGSSVFSEGPEWGYNEYHSPTNTTATKQNVESSPELRIQSVWDAGGGHVFKSGDLASAPMRFKRLARTCARHVPNVGSEWNRVSELPAAMRYEIAMELTVGHPQVGKERAKSIIESIQLHEHTDTEQVTELSDEKIEHLEELGYR